MTAAEISSILINDIKKNHTKIYVHTYVNVHSVFFIRNFFFVEARVSYTMVDFQLQSFLSFLRFEPKSFLFFWELSLKVS